MHLSAGVANAPKSSFPCGDQQLAAQADAGFQASDTTNARYHVLFKASTRSMTRLLFCVADNPGDKDLILISKQASTRIGTPARMSQTRISQLILLMNVPPPGIDR